MHDFELSNAQVLGALDSTGIVSTNVFDMELDGSGGETIIEDDQLVGILNITIPPNAAQVAGDEGMDIILYSNDNADMTTGVEVLLGQTHVSQAELIAGCVKNIEVIKSLTQKFVGAWYKATSTTLTTGQLADAHFSIAPLTENGKLQKVPSR
jgi:hypothetical protein